MSRLWHFCTIVLLFHQYVHICSASSSSFSSSFTADLFENWRQEYGKTYSSEQEKQYRLRVLKDNYDYITQHNNKANSTYTLSLNAFADLTHHEFKAKYLLGQHLSSSVNDLDSYALLEAVAAAKPVSVGICGSDRPFQFYSRGIFTAPCCDTLNHAVLIVGYDSRNGIEYWNVKNSWGTSLGINGYMHLERKNRNSFGINREVIRYPVTESSPSLSLSPSPNPSPTFVKCFAISSVRAHLYSSSSSSLTADLFESWRLGDGKTYSSEQEKQYKIRVFEDNYDYITQHNNKTNSSYTLSLNAFANLTHHEFKAKYLLRRRLSASANTNPIRGSSAFV